jgi:DNA-binding CsgD family transcriptional regulator
MRRFVNIEFFTDPEGRVMISDEGGVRSFREEDRELAAMLYARIEDDYPEAFKALGKVYSKSSANVPYYRYLVVSRFLRCNFGVFDRRTDIGVDGMFKLEEVSCPIRCECQWANVICNARRDNKLTERQREVMKRYCEGYTEEQIAEDLFISGETVKTTKRNAFRKVGAHTLAEFMRITNNEL